MPQEKAFLIVWINVYDVREWLIFPHIAIDNDLSFHEFHSEKIHTPFPCESFLAYPESVGTI
jgi:hypothetical protein